MKTSRNTVIESLGVYLPPRSVTSREILDDCHRKVLFPLEQVTGIRSRRMAEGEFSFDLAVKAVRTCLDQSRHRPEDIDMVVCCNISRCDAANQISLEPSTAVRLKHEFNFSSALAFDLSNACAGVFTGIYLVDAFLKAGVIRRGMVVSGEYITHVTKTAQREIKGFTDPRLACLTLGDSGAAVILEPGNDPAKGFQIMEIFTLPQYSGYCIAKTSDKPAGGAIMITDAVKLSTVAMREATSHACEIQERLGWPSDAVDQLIMHQTSEHTLSDAMERVNKLFGKQVCSKENTIFNVKERGNTASTSHILAFQEHAMAGAVQNDQNVLFSVSASGLTIGSFMYTCDDLPGRIRTGRKSRAPEPDRSMESAGETPEPRIVIESVGLLPENSAARKETLEMARIVAEECLERSRHDRSEIDALIFCGVYRTDCICEPAVAALLAHELAMNDGRDPDRNCRTLCFDIHSGSLSYLMALSAAARLIQSGRANHVMVVAAEIEPNADGEQLGLEPSASATILEKSPTDTGLSRFFFKDFTEHLGAFTSYCDLSVPGGQLNLTRDAAQESLYLDCLETTIGGYLQKMGIVPSDVKFVAGLHLEPASLDRIKICTGLKNATFLSTGHERDLFTSAIPFGLWPAIQCGQLLPGDLGLCLSVGSGIQVGCALYQA
jgi:3-oxoacyl-[acyl-carrier-protein] synthase III